MPSEKTHSEFLNKVDQGRTTLELITELKVDSVEGEPKHDVVITTI